MGARIKFVSIQSLITSSQPHTAIITVEKIKTHTNVKTQPQFHIRKKVTRKKPVQTIISHVEQKYPQLLL